VPCIYKIEQSLEIKAILSVLLCQFITQVGSILKNVVYNMLYTTKATLVTPSNNICMPPSPLQLMHAVTKITLPPPVGDCSRAIITWPINV